MVLVTGCKQTQENYWQEVWEAHSPLSSPRGLSNKSHHWLALNTIVSVENCWHINGTVRSPVGHLNKRANRVERLTPVYADQF